jgi:glucose-6-phosphate isomerase
MKDRPFTTDIHLPGGVPGDCDNHIVRKLSNLKGIFQDDEAFLALLAEGDPCAYEVYEVDRPKTPGEMMSGVSIVHPGKVGREFFMTKGHFHEVLETAEIYYCLQGRGIMLMETPEGDWATEELRPGGALYIPPRWAHRSVNTRLDGDLVTYFIYPGHAGHDYKTIETRGFRKLVLDRNGAPEIVDNPRWERNR